ncbi:MAG: helix-turn-helix transcriptional regulator [Oscillospiraceae bacterium]|nr:helix-turn-helix transcriptional regulator [Oscillospiraceae bacterium]
MEYVDYFKLFSSRIAELRTEKGVSARDMSLSLGQSNSYINKIENGHAFPSFEVFIYICEYLKITPQEFFEFDTKSPTYAKQILKEFGRLTPKQAEHILEVVKDLTEKK